MLHDAVTLIEDLLTEAIGMTGNELVDRARFERGAGYVRAFNEAFPEFSYFIDMLLRGTPEQTLSTLALWQPSVKDWQPQQRKLAIEFLTELQKRLKNNYGKAQK